MWKPRGGSWDQVQLISLSNHPIQELSHTYCLQCWLQPRCFQCKVCKVDSGSHLSRPIHCHSPLDHLCCDNNIKDTILELTLQRLYHCGGCKIKPPLPGSEHLLAPQGHLGQCRPPPEHDLRHLIFSNLHLCLLLSGESSAPQSHLTRRLADPQDLSNRHFKWCLKCDFSNLKLSKRVWWRSEKMIVQWDKIKD